MTDKPNPHTKEWEKFNELYIKLSKSESLSDPYWYRHLCIQGLLDDTTYNYN